MNAYSQGKSGGDMVFIETAKRLKHVHFLIVTSAMGQTLAAKNGVNAQFIITSQETTFQNIISLYIKRTFSVLGHLSALEQAHAFVGTSDFLPDVLPITVLKLRRRKIPWIQHIFHVISPSRKIPFYAQKFSFFLIKSFADAVVVDNDLLRTELAERGFSPKKITVNHPGIDVHRLQSFRPSKTHVFDGIFMAQLRRSKGVFDLLEIWGLVCRALPGVTLGIIGKGDPELSKELTKEIRLRKLEPRIRILGYLEDVEAFAAIRASRVFVFPSHEEGFGIAALEAQALGRPVVAWNLPVFREVFPLGMVQIPRGDKNVFSERIVQLLTDKKMYEKISGDAVQNAKRYSWEKTAQKEHSILNAVIKTDTTNNILS